MKTLRRRKSRRERALALAGDYIKRAPVKPLAIAGAIGAAGLVAVRKLGGSTPAAA